MFVSSFFYDVNLILCKKGSLPVHMVGTKFFYQETENDKREKASASDMNNKRRIVRKLISKRCFMMRCHEKLTMGFQKPKNQIQGQ